MLSINFGKMRILKMNHQRGVCKTTRSVWERTPYRVSKGREGNPHEAEGT
ncbi:hypothetical protein JWZ98_14165 [Methylomonas sp. EFPC1]|nr:hypothetical protein [Methylomonas sp. EFPC1]QSA99829.1 hypothetical protein JWZ98_14165 [Methylomonas sp. EFPC1]